MVNAVTSLEKHRAKGRKAMPCAVFLAFTPTLSFFLIHSQLYIAYPYQSCRNTPAINVHTSATPGTLPEPSGNVPLLPGTSSKAIGHVRPTIGHARPTIGHTRPDVGHTRPYIGHARPDVGHARPDIGHARPNIGHVRPDVGHARPDIGHARPDVGHKSSIQFFQYKPINIRYHEYRRK
jgi:hypothetical protein